MVAILLNAIYSAAYAQNLWHRARKDNFPRVQICGQALDLLHLIAASNQGLIQGSFYTQKPSVLWCLWKITFLFHSKKKQHIYACSHWAHQLPVSHPQCRSFQVPPAQHNRMSKCQEKTTGFSVRKKKILPSQNVCLFLPWAVTTLLGTQWSTLHASWEERSPGFMRVLSDC